MKKKKKQEKPNNFIIIRKRRRSERDKYIQYIITCYALQGPRTNILIILQYTN